MDNDNRCGVVAIAGRTNSGKSTLLNYILGEKVAIVSRVPQTTRNLIRGILTEKRGQVIFVDTPGIHKPKHRLGKYMNITALDAIHGADIILHICDSFRAPGEEEGVIVKELSRLKKKIVLALNKIDLGGKFIDGYIELWEKARGKPINELCDSVIPIPISGINGTNVDKLLGILFSHLPKGENLYPNDMLSDFPRRLAFADVIREKLFELMRQELPYSIAVLVEEISARSNKLSYIKADIFVERQSQKAIVIGDKGAILKKAGSLARRELEELLEKKVYLELNVKVKENWRQDEELLKEMGIIL